MSRPPRDALRQEILTAAQAQFATLGYRATSLQMVADAVGCSKAALLYHFRTKAAMLEALTADLFADLAAIYRALPDVAAPDRPRRTLELGVALVVKHRSALAMLHGLGDEPDLAAFAQRAEEWTARLRTAMVGARPSATERAAVLAFEHGVLGAALGLQDLDDAALTDALLQLGARIFVIDPGTLAPATL